MRYFEKKTTLLLLIFTMMFSLITISSDNKINAAASAGYVNIISEEIEEIGGDTYITYEFSLDKSEGPITACYVRFRWDPSKMTFDKPNSTADNMTYVNVDIENGATDAYLLDGRTGEKCSVTLKFTNVKETTNIDFSFKPANPGTIEFGGDDLMPMELENIHITGESKITVKSSIENNIQITDDYKDNDGIIVCDSTYDLSLTINGITISDTQLADVTWTTKVIAGFNPADTYIETTNGSSTVNMVKSGVVKVTATYNGNEASIVIVKAGDIDKSGTIDYDDLANLVDYIKSDNLEDLASNTEYVKYLADFNGDGFIDYDDVADLIDVIKGVN